MKTASSQPGKALTSQYLHTATATFQLSPQITAKWSMFGKLLPGLAVFITGQMFYCVDILQQCVIKI